MPRRRTLLIRLLAGAILIALGSTAATAWLAARGTTIAIRQQEGQELADGNKIYRTLLTHAATHRTWSDVGPVVDRLSRETSRQIVLTDTDRRPIVGAGTPSEQQPVQVDPLKIHPDFGGTTGIAAEALGPFRLSAADRNRLDRDAEKALRCLRSTTGAGVIDRLPNGHPVLTGAGAPAKPCVTMVEELDRTTASEKGALAELQKLADGCLRVREIGRVSIALDLSWSVTPTGDPDQPGNSASPDARRRAAACVESARRTQLAPYVAPAALLWVTTASSASAGFDLSSASQKRIAAAAAAVLLLTLLITVAGGIRLVQPLQALTRASGRMADGDDSVRVRVRGSDEIAQLSGAFNAMADSRARTEQLRRTMVSDIAHELRTPLSNIRGWLEAIEDGVAVPDTVVIASLSGEAAQLQHIIDDLRDLATADAGTLRIHPERVHLATIFDQVTTAQRSSAASTGVTLTAAAAPELEFEADPVRLRQMIGNLVGNALRFTPPGGSVTVTGRQAGPTAVIDVHDTGTGITADDLPKVFDRFWRADQSRTRHTGGSGLGLAIVRSLAEAHGGTVTAASIPGTGSTFTVTLPIRPTEPRELS